MSITTNTQSTIHGDVDLKPSSLPVTAKETNLAETNKTPHGTWIELGEHTGNYHAIAPTIGGEVKFYLDIDGVLYTEVIEQPAIMYHQEHAPIYIYPGIYKKMIETEYDPFAKVIKQVVD
jgi:hypothetical protein